MKKRIFISAPTKVEDWVIAAQELLLESKVEVVGILHSSEDVHKNSQVKFINSKKLAESFFVMGNQEYSALESEYEDVYYKYQDIFKELLNRDYWAYLKHLSKDIFLFYYDFWNKKFYKNSFDAVIFNITPHKIFDFPLYVLAVEKGLNVNILTWIPEVNLSFNRNRINSLPVLKRQTKEPSPQQLNACRILNKWLNRMSRDYKEGIPPSEKKLRREVKSLDKNYYFLSKIRRGRGNLRIYSKFLLLSPLSFLEYIFSSLTFDLALFVYRSFYSYLSKDFKIPKKYIYFPLHFQPERTTAPEGWRYSNQFSFLNDIVKYLPNDYVLVVKEHPMQFSKLSQNLKSRTIWSYLKLYKNPRVKFAPLMYDDPYSLIDNSNLVLSITGTVVLEALVRNKPVAYVGYPWYAPLFPSGFANKDDIKDTLDIIRNASINPSGIVKHSKDYIIDLVCSSYFIN